MLTAVNYGIIGIGDIVKLMSLNPSKIFNIEGKGSIEPGFDADLTVVDLDREWVIDSSKFHSKAKFSPFDGFRVRGMVKATFVNGLMVYDGDEIVCRGGEIVFGSRIRG
jgi:dihydroorotase